MPDRLLQRTALRSAAKRAPEAGARVFFALWPDAPVRRGLDDLARRVHQACGGRKVRTESIHLTLVFVGQVEIPRVETLKSAASRVDVPAFDLHLDRAGYWKHNRIAWVGARETPQPLAGLVRALEQGLEESGLRFDKRPYVPHLTLVRKAMCREPVAAAADIPWRVEEFVLVRSALSQEAAAYEIIGRWTLR